MKTDEHSVNLTPFFHDSCARSVIFPLLRHETYSKQLIYNPDGQGKNLEQFWIINDNLKEKKLVFSGDVSLPRRSNRGQVPWPISQKRLNKKTIFVLLVALLEIRIISSNEPNRCILQGVTAKIRYRTKWPQRRDTAHSELKLTFWTT